MAPKANRSVGGYERFLRQCGASPQSFLAKPSDHRMRRSLAEARHRARRFLRSKGIRSGNRNARIRSEEALSSGRAGPSPHGHLSSRLIADRRHFIPVFPARGAVFRRRSLCGTHRVRKAVRRRNRGGPPHQGTNPAGDGNSLFHRGGPQQIVGQNGRGNGKSRTGSPS